jgi:hypothetical protein
MRTNDPTYAGLIRLRDRLEIRHSELKRELDVITHQLESVSTTLELLDDSDAVNTEENAGASAFGVVGSVPSNVDVSSLRGLTQVDALKLIAEHNGGQFYTSTAKRLLLQAGLIKNPKNANNIIFSVVQRSGAFERVTPGVYRLINKPTRPDRSGAE